jgi:hypothetical protein
MVLPADRGEGANHAIVDVKDFSEIMTPVLVQQVKGESGKSLRQALDEYEDAAVARTRPAVLASRRACMDGHEWARIDEQSPLLSPRQMRLNFDEERQCLVAT